MTDHNGMGKEWAMEQQARAERMEKLYELDERDKDDHPYAHTFTGLHEEILIYEKWAKRSSYFPL